MPVRAGDPFVVGLDHLREVVVRQDSFRQITAGADDGNGALWLSGSRARLGVRFMVAAHFLDDMWIDLLFNRLARHAQGILDRERSAGAVGDDADAIDAEERHAAVFFVIHFLLDRMKGFLRQVGAGHPHLAFHQFVLEPLEDRVADRFARFENDVADKAVADHHLDRMSKQIVPFDVAAEIQGAAFQHFEDLLGEIGTFNVLTADRHQADRGILVAEDVTRIDRAHDPVLQQVLGSGVTVRASVDQDKYVRLGRKERGDPRPIDSRQRAQLDRGRRDRRTCVSGADDGRGFSFFHQIDRPADRGVFLPSDGFNCAVGHGNDLGRMNNFDPAIVAVLLLQFGLDLARVADEEEFVDLPIFAQARTAPPTRFGGPKSPPMASRAIFIEAPICDFQPANAKRKILECGRGLGAAKGRQGRIHSGSEDRGAKAPPTLGRLAPFHRQDLPALIVSAGRAGCVRRHRAAALRTFIELRRLPAMRSLARAQPHL